MKNGVFSAWLKEFCSLIFTQAVQAFLLAIIMSVVIFMASNEAQGQYSGSEVQATSIIAIIAISSISKIELLIKRIFGVESQFGDPALKNGQKSMLSGIAGSFAAFSLGKRVLDNPRKIVGGIMDWKRGTRAINRVQRNRARDFANFEERMAAANKGSDKKETLPAANGNENDTSKQQATNLPDGVQTTYTIDGNGVVVSGGGGSSSGVGAGGSGSGNIIIQNPQNVTISSANFGTASFTNARVASGNIAGNGDGSGDSGGKAKKMSQADWDNERNKLNDKYDDLLDKARENRNKAKKMVASGLTETVGAIAGAGAGLSIKTVVDLAQGDANLSSSVKGAMTGLGVGDWIGTKAVDVTSRISEEIKDSRADKEVKAETVRYVNAIKESRKKLAIDLELDRQNRENRDKANAGNIS